MFGKVCSLCRCSFLGLCRVLYGNRDPILINGIKSTHKHGMYTYLHTMMIVRLLIVDVCQPFTCGCSFVTLFVVGICIPRYISTVHTFHVSISTECERMKAEQNTDGIIQKNHSIAKLRSSTFLVRTFGISIIAKADAKSIPQTDAAKIAVGRVSKMRAIFQSCAPVVDNADVNQCCS